MNEGKACISAPKLWALLPMPCSRTSLGEGRESVTRRRKLTLAARHVRRPCVCASVAICISFIYEHPVQLCAIYAAGMKRVNKEISAHLLHAFLTCLFFISIFCFLCYTLFS